jgi:chromosome partitioning protein
VQHIIAVINQKGGVGKTTTALSLGAYLAKAGHSVLVVDFDPQGNATGGLGLDKHSPDITAYEILFDPATATTAVKETNSDNLYILPSNANLAAAEIDLAGESRREYRLQAALQNLTFDFILIDCPPALGLLTINALTAADNLLIPVQAEYYALEGLGQLLEVVQRVRGGLNPQLELLGVAVTMFDSRTALAEQVLSEIKKHFAEKVFKTVIPRNVRLAEAPSYGQTILEHDKWSKGARAYKQLTKEVVRRVSK